MQNQISVATFRRLTPAMVESQRLAMANDIVATTKAEVAITLKKAAPALGIEGTTYHILDILLGLTKADDWKQDRRPLVAISNEKLADYVGRSTRTVARSLKKLVEAGILAYRDSPTGRRFIYRNEVSGDIDRGFGLDFSPARQRIKELQGIADAFSAELKAKQEAKRNVTRLSRAIADLLAVAALEGLRLEEHEAELSVILASAIPNNLKADRLSQLYEAIVAAFGTNEAAAEGEATAAESETSFEEMSGAPDTDVTPYNITTRQNSKKSNERPSPHVDDLKSRKAYGFDKAPEKEPSRKSGATDRTRSSAEPPKAKPSVPPNADGTSPLLSEVSIGLINTATRETQDILGGAFRSWGDLMGRTSELRLLVGLSEAGWRGACSRVGQHVAAAVLVTTAEKALRDPDQLARPAGYFLACIDRAVDGKLALHRSLFGLAQG
ncbi:plasmid replication protein RepC [Pseudovibrio sp. SPO723]|uniref:plasmid replication protein RepC n=1 Tax=Nesiotobacter zosterae TaxID=392721 RepID=UPI0029C25EDE|nr:plasmid replication protein RepC [Pseudovibrio sp. SPO723]MDX5593430.1 plasmid replication protein RepC [Pseudovibrio sp. SPO723]